MNRRALYALALFTAALGCGDDDGPGADAGPSADGGADGGVDAAVEPDGGMFDGSVDAGSDGGIRDPFPSTPTEITVPLGGEPPSNVEVVGVAATSGGHAIALYRATTAGEQHWVAVYDPATSSWRSPTLLQGRDARVAASGDAAMVIYVACREGGGCGNGHDLYAQRFTDAGGWEELVQLDDLDASSPFFAATTANILYARLAGDGAGGFLVTWNHQSANTSLFREHTGGSWRDVIGETGTLVSPGFHFVGHAPRRYVGAMSAAGLGGTRAVVDGVVQTGATGSQNWGAVEAFVQGDRVVFTGAGRGMTMEATWNGSTYDWSEVSNSRRRQQDRPILAGQGEHVVDPFWWASGSGGYRFQVEAMVRHDQSGDGSLTYGWTHVLLHDPTGPDDHALPVEAVAVDDGVVVLVWQGASGNNGVVPWDLLAFHVGFDSNDAIVVAAPVTLATSAPLSERQLRDLPFAAVRDGDDLLAVWGDALLGVAMATATVGSGTVVAGASRAVSGDGTFVGAPVEIPGPAIAYGAFSILDATLVSTNAAAAAHLPPLDARVEATWYGNGYVGFAPDRSASFLFARPFLDRTVLTLSSYADESLAPSVAVPEHVGARQWVAATDGTTHALVSLWDLGGSFFPEGMHLHHADASGTWTRSERIETGDTRIRISNAQVVAHAGGYVVLWLERSDGGEATVRGVIHTGAAWGTPFTLDATATGEIAGGNGLLVTENDDAVVCLWQSATDDLRTAVLTDLAAGFGTPTALRTDTAPTVLRVHAASGGAGHLVVVREDDGDATTYVARVLVDGSWSTVEEPFGSLTETAPHVALAVDDTAFGIAYASASGVQVARHAAGSWSASEVLAGTWEAPTLLASAAGLRLVAYETSGAVPVFHSRLHDGTAWAAETTFDGSTSWTVEEEETLEAWMNDAGDAAYLASGDEDGSVYLLVHRADGTLETTTFGVASTTGVQVVPNGTFLVYYSRPAQVGARELVVSFGH